MSLKERVEAARERYLSQLRRMIRGKKKSKNPSVPELLLLMNGPASIPRKHLLYRIDLAQKVKGENKFTEFNDELETRFPPELYGNGTLTTLLHPIVWNGCEFHFTASRPPWSSVDVWHKRWIDEKGRRPRDKDGLGGVIHHMSRPEKSGRVSSFSIDFGSAPAEAFDELLEALEADGVKKLEVGSFHLDSGPA